MTLKRRPAKDERQLIRKAQSGDRAAFGQLVRRYERPLLSVVINITGNRELARDVTQESFVKAWTALSQFNSSRVFFTWLYRIAVNASFDALRREKRFQSETLDANTLASQDLSPERILESGDLGKIMKALMQRLSTPQRTALLLRDVKGFNAREVAEIMNCPHGTVRSHLSLARQQLKQWITNEYPEWTEEI